MGLWTRKPSKKFTRRYFHWATLASMHTWSLPQLTGQEMRYSPSHPLSLLDFGRYTLIKHAFSDFFYTLLSVIKLWFDLPKVSGVVYLLTF